jgi:NTP pyrophosphatase (non-canonical NTP hydrolase)
MNLDRVVEALDLLQEECGEIVQARSKIRRFGEEFRKHGGKSDTTAQEELQHEIWDFMILTYILDYEGYIQVEPSPEYLADKIQRLKEWTTLYDNLD